MGRVRARAVAASARDSTILLTPLSESTSSGNRLCLAWRVYLMHGPMFPFSPPPVAVVVRPNGAVRRVDFASAVQAASHGDPAPLDAQFKELTRYATRADIRVDRKVALESPHRKCRSIRRSLRCQTWTFVDLCRSPRSISSTPQRSVSNERYSARSDMLGSVRAARNGGHAAAAAPAAQTSSGASAKDRASCGERPYRRPLNRRLAPSRVPCRLSRPHQRRQGRTVRR